MKKNINILFVSVLTILLAFSFQNSDAQNKTIKSYKLDNTRDMRFGEFVVIKSSGIEVYNTAGLNDCPADLWNAMDPGKLAAQFGAEKVLLNGPQYYLADTVTLWLRETADFGGIKARFDAALNSNLLEKNMKVTEPYKVFKPEWKQKMVFAKGNPVYELIDPDGNNYVLQARKENVQMQSLATLDQEMKSLPKDWRFRTRILTEDLVLDFGPGHTVNVVSDEFNQFYAKPEVITTVDEEIQLLYVQTSENIIVDSEAKTFRLVNVNMQTLYFSDRPERIAGHIKMDKYLESWTSDGGKNNFNQDPPNASLSVYEPGQAENSVVVVEISYPVIEGNDLIYKYNLIDGKMPVTGGSTSLFIDVIGNRGIGLGHRGPGI